MEVARIVSDAPLKIFSFIEEEGARFGSGILGSRCVAGLASAEDLKQYKDSQGTSAYEAAREAGYSPDQVEECRRSLEGVERYLEVHIEQGRVLEEGAEDIGVVEAIAGMLQATLEIEGRADHAGATPMHLRSDAGLTAAEVIVELERVAREAGGSVVGTVGRVELYPGALNVIPGRTLVGLDIRDVDAERSGRVLERVLAFARERTERRGQRVSYREHLDTAPVRLNPDVTAALQKAAERVGVSNRRMVSGAGHDAMMIAQQIPAGMLFVPSRGGISHSPEEFTEPRHLAQAVAVLIEATKGR